MAATTMDWCGAAMTMTLAPLDFSFPWTTMVIIKIMVLKIGPDWLVRPPIGHGSCPVRPIGSGSNQIRIRQFEPTVRPVNRSVPYGPNSSFSFPSSCGWYPHYHMEHRSTDNGGSTVAWSIIPSAAPPALRTLPTSPCRALKNLPDLGNT